MERIEPIDFAQNVIDQLEILLAEAFRLRDQLQEEQGG